MNDNEIRDLFAALPELRQEEENTAHHGRVARFAQSAYQAIQDEEWPRRTYSDDIFPPCGSSGDPRNSPARIINKRARLVQGRTRFFMCLCAAASAAKVRSVQ